MSIAGLHGLTDAKTPDSGFPNKRVEWVAALKGAVCLAGTDAGQERSEKGVMPARVETERGLPESSGQLPMTTSSATGAKIFPSCSLGALKTAGWVEHHPNPFISQLWPFADASGNDERITTMKSMIAVSEAADGGDLQLAW